MTKAVVVLIVVGLAAAGPCAHAAWVDFVEESSTRLVAQPDVGTADTAQKAYAWGDVDRDGDPDLVVARKKAWVNLDVRTNVLFINENGVLTDRTAEFAIDSLAAGDQGFLTATNDQDVVLVDVDQDGWLDVVTAPTYVLGQDPNIGYPRVYRNRGCTGACAGTSDWLGFRFEPARIPTMLSDSGESGHFPCFIHVDAGDVDGDGYPDLWFTDSDAPAIYCSGAADFNNKLLLNLGETAPGQFVDVTESMLPGDFNVSSFGTSGWVRDMNGDDLNDLIKQDDGAVTIAYHSTSDPFGTVSSVYDSGAYYTSAGDLNRDHRLDLIVSDEQSDRYLLNDGTAIDGAADFVLKGFSFQHSGAGGAANEQGYSGDSRVADLNNDGWDDVVISDVDAAVPGCTRRMHVYRNLGGLPGGNVNLEEQTSGAACAGVFGNSPDCIVASIPSDMLAGVHDVAVFDINGDSWLDLVVGRCSGTEVYVNQPPGPPAGSIEAEIGPDSQLQIAKSGTDTLSLSWGASCAPSDTDYSIYEGRSASGFASHRPVACSTGGSTTYTHDPPGYSSYYLVVPHNGFVEGSYGTTSVGDQRPHGTTVCLPRYIGGCQ